MDCTPSHALQHIVPAQSHSTDLDNNAASRAPRSVSGRTGYKAAETMMRQKADGSGAEGASSLPRSRFQLHRVWLEAPVNMDGRRPRMMSSNAVFSDQSSHYFEYLLVSYTVDVEITLHTIEILPTMSGLLSIEYAGISSHRDRTRLTSH